MFVIMNFLYYITTNHISWHQKHGLYRNMVHNCNHLFSSAFYLDGDWFSITSKINEMKKPQTLKPSTA
ncbi:Uncharacterized protein FWK35_00035491 [Aphis craccivora]|uniref:Uncharacterized protein n=1 Tax=Aphis craccivora TaxID=307492 RepID=A0A6G0VGS2_APHCR|nr:Uncharacterized protein FWK35_00035491 [Aphis craccivora]